MAGPKAAEKGTRGSFKLRAGIDFPAFDGMVRENDGAAIPDEAFQQLENVIFKGINPKDRPGLVRVTNQLGSIEGLYDATDIGAATAAVPRPIDDATAFSVACPWFEINAGTDDGHNVSIDSAQTPVLTSFDRPWWRNANALFNGSRLYILTSDVVANIGGGRSLAQVTGFDSEVDVWAPTVAGVDTYDFEGIIVIGATMFIVAHHLHVASGVYTTEVFTWSGSGSPALDHTFAQANGNSYFGGIGVTMTGAHVQLYQYGSDLMMVWHNSATGFDELWKRTAAGAWSQVTLSVTPHGGSNIVSQINGGVEFGGVFYFGISDTGNSSYVYGWNGVGPAAATSPRIETPAIDEASAPTLFVFGGNLYYFWTSSADTSTWIGKFTGAVWTNQFLLLCNNIGSGIAIITAIPGFSAATFGVPTAIVSGGNLYLLMNLPISGVPHRFVIHTADLSTWALDNLDSRGGSTSTFYLDNPSGNVPPQINPVSTSGLVVS